jgi:hypothetical protein
MKELSAAAGASAEAGVLKSGIGAELMGSSEKNDTAAAAGEVSAVSAAVVFGGATVGGAAVLGGAAVFG